MIAEGAEPVSRDEFERRLAAAAARASDPMAGLFGPGSMRWRIDRESALFLGAGRALLLQFAHPWVAAGVLEHSRAMNDPIGRFHRTFQAVYSIVFGTVDQALATSRALHRGHARVEGAMPAAAGPFEAGSRYRANDVAALAWVFATLVDSALTAHDLVLPPLRDPEREAYYAESRRFAACFGVPDGALPPDWSGFRAYVDAMTASPVLTVMPGARELADRFLAGAGTWWLFVPATYRALTGDLLPDRLRDGFGLPDDPRLLRAARRQLGLVRRAYPRLPARLRFVGPYLEAAGRLAGRPHPDAWTRASNRFWIGRSALPGP
ncbi:oxygenase MpaB family protein [Skermanella rosea]|uniref:oxygenase MpaB family protein n=1 Tax=Skermanella rosea TaxID=1817965 RepID=UPI0019320738|nr:oxygenase MpaB family protein [Skermanella rosea]